MLKRIALITKDKELAAKATALTKKNTDIQIVARSKAGELKPGTVAVIADVDSFSSGLKQALTLGKWNEEMLFLLADALDCRESLDAGTSRRVVEHAIRFAQAVGLSANDELTLTRAMLVRDIGKIRIANAVLLKDGLLDYDEWSLIHTHPRLGPEILMETDSLKDAAEIVQNHHECYDGTGYPNGIEGEEIPFMARMAKIIDVYCAMTSARAYRKGHSTHEEAIEFIVSEKDKHFDSVLVDIFVEAGVGETSV